MKVLTLKGAKETRVEFQGMLDKQQKLFQSTQDAILRIEGALALLDSIITTMEKPKVEEKK